MSSNPPKPVTPVPGTPESRRNLYFYPLEQLSWAEADRAASLEKIYEYVRNDAANTIGWYLNKKDTKKRWAQRLRVGAILLTSAAALVTLLAGAPLFQDYVQPVWASVLLVLAGTLVGLDYFFGFSSAWMRFLDTELKIRCALEEFQLGWQADKAAVKDGAPTDQAVQKMLQRCQGFQERVNALLRQEMDAWMQEFRAALANIDRGAKREGAEQAEGGAPGGNGQGRAAAGPTEGGGRGA